MSNEGKKETIWQAARAISQGDSSAYERFMTRDFYNYSPPAGEETAPEVFGRIMADISAAFPDLSVTVADFSEDGDEVSFNMTLSGTHSNNLWGAPGSGKSGSWTSAAAVRFSGDKFAFHWPELAVPDVLGALRQIDLVPPPEDMDKPPKHPISLPEVLIKTLFMGQMADKECSHLENIKVTQTDTDVCHQCIEAGDIWPALRMCLTCGYVGCCDTSKNKHMKAHYEETGHPLFRSIRLQESWVWCYADNAMFSGKILENYG
jgi:predicted ester cyclase